MNKMFLKDIAYSQTGPFGSQLHEEDYVETGTPIVTVEHLGEISFTNQNLPLVSDEDKERLKKYVLIEGDIVFSRVGSVDRCTYVSKIEDGWLFSGRCIRVRIDKVKADPKFISFYFRQNNFKQMMRNIAVGATMPSLNTSLMDNIPLTIPNLPTQRKIASVLSGLEDKIKLNNEINADLEAMAKTLYDYWFVQFDFPNSDGKPYKSCGGEMVYNEQLKREIPEGWEVCTVSELAKTGSGGTPLSTKLEYYNDGKIAWINSGETNNPFIINTKNYITELGLKNSSAKIFPKNTLLMAMYGATAGKVSFLKFEATTNQAICAIIPNNKEHTYLLKYTLESMYQYLINLSSGSARDNLSQDKIKKLQIINPNEIVLTKFHQFVDGLYNKYYINSQQNQELASLRDWLLPMLMNGQVTVKDAFEG